VDPRREWQRRDRSNREQDSYRMGDPRGFRTEEASGKRRAMEPTASERENYQQSQRSRYDQSHNPYPSVLDRLGPKSADQASRGKMDSTNDRGGTVAGKDAVNGVCFWCRKEGHHQATCTNPPFCFRCKKDGHISAKCPSNQGCSLNMYGFGFPNQGFYCLKIPGAAKQMSIENVGLIQIRSGEASTERLEDELKNLIDKNWAWKVRKLTDREYLATFPNKMLLDTFSRSKSLDLALYSISVTISHSPMDPRATSTLQTGWVQLLNVPDQALNTEAVTLIAELAGEVVAVDELSIIKEGPVRVRLRARDVSKLKGFVEIFVDGVGYEVKFIPELKQRPTAPPPPTQGKPDDDEDMEDDDADDLSDYEGEIRRRLQEPIGTKHSSDSKSGRPASNNQVSLVGGKVQEEGPQSGEKLGGGRC